jgi:hypothetical protein
LIVEDAKFWVVEPRVTLSVISGPAPCSGNTRFEVGKSGKEAAHVHGPRDAADHHLRQPGRQFVPRPRASARWGSARRYYRSLQAGQVVAYELARDGKGLTSESSSTRPTTARQRRHPLGTRAASTCRSAPAAWRRTEPLVASRRAGVRHVPGRGQHRASRRPTRLRSTATAAR